MLDIFNKNEYTINLKRAHITFPKTHIHIIQFAEQF